MGEHTKEPWDVFDSTARNMFIVGHLNSPTCLHESNEVAAFMRDEEENAKRIVACVNKCAGFTNEQLESGDLILTPNWKPFNQEDKGTWPDEGEYLIFQQKEYSWEQSGVQTKHIKQNFRCAYFQQGRWFHKKFGLATYDDVTKYMPIPEG